MFNTKNMEISLFLAKVIGLFLIVDGLVILIRSKELMSAVSEIKNDKFSIMFLGMLVLIMGLLITISHNIWTGSAFQVVITIIGWLMAIKGLVVSLLPMSVFDRLLAAVNKPVLYQISGVVVILVGIWLSIVGFTL